jgi:hypothetical protein
MKINALLLGAALALLAMAPGRAQAMTPTSAQDAVRVAQGGVDPSIRDHIVSLYGVGTPDAVQTWWVIFYDSSLSSHGQAVKVENGKIVNSYAAKGGVVYDNALTFPASQVTPAGPALAAARNYAAEHALPYDSVRVLMRNTPNEPAFRWRVQMMNGPASKGFVFVNATDGSFALYSPPGSVSTGSSSNTGGVVGDAKRAGNDVKNTFLGIGGDLQQFFTGERTVDQ